MYANPLLVPQSRDTGCTFIGPNRYMSLGLSVTDRQSVLLALLNLFFFLHFFFTFFVLKGTPKHPESIWRLVVFL